MKELSADEMTSIRGGSKLELGTVKIVGMQGGVVENSSTILGPIDSFNGNGTLLFLIEGNNDQIIL